MSYEIIHGNCLEVLQSDRVPAGSVHAVVSSPPYFGLRVYPGVPNTVWGGDPNCAHVWEPENVIYQPGRLVRGLNASPYSPDGGGVKHAAQEDVVTERGFCRHCPAWLGTLGNEPSPELYIQHLGEVLRGIHRVLRPDGTAWINLGDSYWGTGGGQKNSGKSTLPSANWPLDRPRQSRILKPKDLVGIPWRFAFSAQGFAVLPAADLLQASEWLRAAREQGDWELVETVEGLLRGWSALAPFVTSADALFLRADILWHKPNPQPSPVRDNCTRAHEYWFLLSKSRHYYFDADAIAEPLADLARYERVLKNRETFDPAKHKAAREDVRTAGGRQGANPKSPMEILVDGAAAVVAKGTRNKRSVWSVAPVELSMPAELAEQVYGPGVCDPDLPPTVWTVPTGGFKGPHYATFPPQLIEPCIQAGTPARGCCPMCGAPWRRLTRALHRKGRRFVEGEWEDEAAEKGVTGAFGRGGRSRVGLDHKSAEEKRPVIQTVGWRPTCRHYDDQYRDAYPLPREPKPGRDPVQVALRWQRFQRLRPGLPTWPTLPARVLDPFGGMATTALVADRLGRHGISVELNPRDVVMARDRLENDRSLLSWADGEPDGDGAKSGQMGLALDV